MFETLTEITDAVASIANQSIKSKKNELQKKKAKEKCDENGKKKQENG